MISQKALAFLLKAQADFEPEEEESYLSAIELYAKNRLLLLQAEMMVKAARSRVESSEWEAKATAVPGKKYQTAFGTVRCTLRQKYDLEASQELEELEDQLRIERSRTIEKHRIQLKKLQNSIDEAKAEMERILESPKATALLKKINAKVEEGKRQVVLLQYTSEAEPF